MSAKKKTLAGAHKAAMIFVGALILILAVTLGFVRYWWTTIDTFNDTDGTLYNVRRNGDAYALYDAKGNLLPTTIEDEKLCYVTELGTIVMLDNRGTASIYAVVDTGEGEEVSVGQRLFHAQLARIRRLGGETLCVVEVGGSGNGCLYRIGGGDRPWARSCEYGAV